LYGVVIVSEVLWLKYVFGPQKYDIFFGFNSYKKVYSVLVPQHFKKCGFTFRWGTKSTWFL